MFLQYCMSKKSGSSLCSKGSSRESKEQQVEHLTSGCKVAFVSAITHYCSIDHALQALCEIPNAASHVRPLAAHCAIGTLNSNITRSNMTHSTIRCTQPATWDAAEGATGAARNRSRCSAVGISTSLASATTGRWFAVGIRTFLAGATRRRWTRATFAFLHAGIA